MFSFELLKKLTKKLIFRTDLVISNKNFGLVTRDSMANTMWHLLAFALISK